MHAPPPDPGTDARTLRRQNRAAVERLRANRLRQLEVREERRTRLVESLAFDWITPYTDLLNQSRSDPVFAGPSSAWQRRRGTNYPIFRTEAELNLLRAPARLLVATNSYAQGLIEGLTSYVIGPGYTYRVAPRHKHADAPPELLAALQLIVDATLQRNQWYGGEEPGLEEELFGRSVEDGEFLLVHYPRDDGTTEFRVAEPEQLTAPPEGVLRDHEFDYDREAGEPDGTFGVITPADDSQLKLAYWFQWGDSPTDGEMYTPDEVTHFRRNVKRSMKRGVTDFCFDALDAVQLAGDGRDRAVRAAGEPGGRRRPRGPHPHRRVKGAVMALIAGYGGTVTLTASPVNLAVGKWKLDKKRALANVTNSKSGGMKQRLATVKDQMVTLEGPLDDAINPEASGFAEGATVAMTLTLGGGSSHAWTSTAVIIESISYENDEDEDAARFTLVGYAQSAFTYT